MYIYIYTSVIIIHKMDEFILVICVEEIKRFILDMIFCNQMLELETLTMVDLGMILDLGDDGFLRRGLRTLPDLSHAELRSQSI